MPDDRPAIEGTLHELRALATDTEAARRAVELEWEGESDDYLTKLEDRLSDAYDGLAALHRTASEAVERCGKRFSDWVKMTDVAIDAIGLINASEVPRDDDECARGAHPPRGAQPPRR